MTTQLLHQNDAGTELQAVDSKELLLQVTKRSLES